MKKVNVFLLVGIAALAMTGMTLLFVRNMMAGSGRYSTFAGAKKTGAEVHVQGQWVRREEIKEDPNYFEFYLQDSTGGVSLVRYSDPRPANLEQAQKILVKGKYQGEVFFADKMFMKCPSKYQGTEIPEEMK